MVIWAGMRGAVTLAAAQTLPEDTPSRSLLILIAFLVAAGSLLLQGGTISWVVALVKPAGRDPALDRDEHVQVMQLLNLSDLRAQRAAHVKPREPAGDRCAAERTARRPR